MKFAHFFIERPVFAAVLSIVTIIVGGDRDLHVADRAVPGNRAADGDGQRQLSRRQRQDGCRDRRHADRGADQRRGRHDLHVEPEHERRQHEADRHVQARDEPRHRPGAGAEPRGDRAAGVAVRGAAGGHRGEEGVAGHHAGGGALFAGRITRPAVSEQLRDAADQGRAGAPAGRGRHLHLRRPRLFDAAVAEPGASWRRAI